LADSLKSVWLAVSIELLVPPFSIVKRSLFEMFLQLSTLHIFWNVLNASKAILTHNKSSTCFVSFTTIPFERQASLDVNHCPHSSSG